MKLNLNRLIDAAKYAQTDAGKQLGDLIDFLARFTEQVVSALQRGLTFGDNFDADVVQIKLRTGVAQVVNARKQVLGMIPTRVLSSTYALDSFLWYYDTEGRLTVKATFTGSPAASLDISVGLVILYG